MARVYTTEFENVAVSAAQDFFEWTPADDKPCVLLGFELQQLSDVGDAEEEMIRLRVIRGHTTSGSGGSSVTPRAVDPNDAAAGFSSEANNTTIASVGTTQNLWSGGMNIRIPEPKIFTVETYIQFSQANTTMVLRLLAAPTDSITMSGTAWIKEL